MSNFALRKFSKSEKKNVTGETTLPDDDDWLGPAHPDELVDGANSSSGQLREQDHALWWDD